MITIFHPRVVGFVYGRIPEQYLSPVGNNGNVMWRAAAWHMNQMLAAIPGFCEVGFGYKSASRIMSLIEDNVFSDNSFMEDLGWGLCASSITKLSEVQIEWIKTNPIYGYEVSEIDNDFNLLTFNPWNLKGDSYGTMEEFWQGADTDRDDGISSC